MSAYIVKQINVHIQRKTCCNPKNNDEMAKDMKENKMQN